jgi:hypothetical protein
MEADKDLELEAGEQDLLTPPFLRLSLYVNYLINSFNAYPEPCIPLPNAGRKRIWINDFSESKSKKI